MTADGAEIREYYLQRGMIRDAAKKVGEQNGNVGWRNRSKSQTWREAEDAALSVVGSL